MKKQIRTLLALSLFMVAAPLVGNVEAQSPAPPGTCAPGEVVISGYCYSGNNPYTVVGPEAPEIHLSSSIAGIVLLFGGMMVLRGRKVQQQR